MYDLFNSTYSGSGKTFPIIKLRTNRAVVQRELARVCSFYRAKPTDADESHVITQLIKILNISIKRDNESTIQACVDRVPEVSKILGLVHPYNSRPVERRGEFYNNHVREIIILDESTVVNLPVVKRQWPVINPIRIVTHPFNDINFHLCNGKYPIPKDGYAVFVVNVPLLILQYKFWVLDCIDKGRSEIRPSRFVGQVLIPNMIGAHMDVCYINRAMDVYRGKLVPVMKRAHPVSIVDITQHVDDTIDSQIAILNQQVADINGFYTVFPAMVRENWLASIQVPDIAPNQNVRWAMVLSTLRYINFLVDYYHEKDPNRLRVISNRIIRSIRSMDNNKEFKDVTTMVGGNMLANIRQKVF